ncbi:MAG TPA: 50S ribosomal protein L28 [Thermomicrobiales bacterium]|nr:50S ribosomal protein L28 [Thermomicrobiales bacterium]
MAGTCEMCGKTLGFGHNVSFSKRRTNRVFRPNIQKATVYTDGRAKKINACTRCIRTMAKLRK